LIPSARKQQLPNRRLLLNEMQKRKSGSPLKQKRNRLWSITLFHYFVSNPSATASGNSCATISAQCEHNVGNSS
jgi:hypothetical protein